MTIPIWNIKARRQKKLEEKREATKNDLLTRLDQNKTALTAIAQSDLNNRFSLYETAILERAALYDSSQDYLPQAHAKAEAIRGMLGQYKAMTAPSSGDPALNAEEYKLVDRIARAYASGRITQKSDEQ